MSWSNFVVLSALASMFAVRVLAQPASAYPVSAAHPIIISSAGGISKGAYQGGLEWGIIEFLRRQRDTISQAEFRKAVGLDRDTIAAGRPAIIRGGVYALRSATGASAGNVNALINGIMWCTRRRQGSHDVSPVNSLYWTMWVNTGLRQMLPSWRNGLELAALDRGFFEQVLRPKIREVLDSSQAFEDCPLPIGLTMTRITPQRVAVAKDGIEANVQRFATIFRMHHSGVGDSARLDFAANGNGKASLGALAKLPELEPGTNNTLNERFGAIYNTVLTSSSFPVAFAMRPVSYIPAGLAAPANGEPAIAAASLFNDGGLFDNNPFALALRLFELDDENPPLKAPNAQRAQRVEPDTVRVIYANPYVYRGALSVARSNAHDAPPQEGLGGLVQMLQGFWDSGHDYELQSMLRQASRDEERGLANTWRIQARRSSRSSPIFGELLGSFAGFLGRLLREYDFYTGVYDGLHYNGRHFICADRRDPNATCADSVTRALIATNPMKIDSIGIAIARWHHDAVRQPSLSAEQVDGMSRPDSIRFALLAMTHAAVQPMVQMLSEGDCKAENDLLGKPLCTSGLLWTFERLKQSPGFEQLARELCEWCLQSAQRSLSESGQCTIDMEFLAFLNDPRGQLNGYLEEVLARLIAAEDSAKRTKPAVRTMDPLIELAFMAYRSVNYEYRRGVSINPGSWKKDTRNKGGWALTALAAVTPHYVQLGRGNAAGDNRAAGIPGSRSSSTAFGWRPVVAHLYGFDVGTLFETARYRDVMHADQPARIDKRIGGSIVMRRFTIPLTSSLELGMLRTNSLYRDEVNAKPRAAIFATARFFGDKMQLGARTVPKRGWDVTFGLSDFGGILYWWFR